DDEQNVESAKEEIAEQVADALNAHGCAVGPSGLVADNIEPAHTRVSEKIVKRTVEPPPRRRLPDTRHAMTHKFDIAGHEGYITAGLYEDGTPGEVFITMSKECSTICGLLVAI